MFFVAIAVEIIFHNITVFADDTEIKDLVVTVERRGLSLKTLIFSTDSQCGIAATCDISVVAKRLVNDSFNRGYALVYTYIVYCIVGTLCIRAVVVYDKTEAAIVTHATIA